MPLRARCLQLMTAIAVFSIAVAPEIAKNINIEGEPFLSSVIARAFPWLYKPSSLSHLVFHSEFLPELLSRFWLEFHNLGMGHRHSAAPEGWLYLKHKRWLVFYRPQPNGLEVMRVVDAVRDLPRELRDS